MPVPPSYAPLLVPAMVCCLGCGPAAPPASHPLPASSAPTVRSSPPPHVRATFNVDALRQTNAAGLVVVLRSLVPDDVAFDDLAWFAIDGPPPTEPGRTYTFFARHDSSLVTTLPPKRGLTRNVAVAETPSPSELLHVEVHSPAKALRIPFFQTPPGVKIVSLVVVTREDGGAVARLRLECADAACIRASRDMLEAMAERISRSKTGEMLFDVFRNASVGEDAHAASLELTASPSQLEAITDMAVTLFRGP